MFSHVDNMHLEDKDIFVLLGPTRTGKGTLLTALSHGVQMKLYAKKEWREFAKEEKVYAANFMAPAGAKGQPIKSDMICHQCNSHTIRPKLVSDKTTYIDKFSALNGLHLVDFPGLFETRGPEIDIAVQLTLQLILKKARSAKVLIMIGA